MTTTLKVAARKLTTAATIAPINAKVEKGSVGVRFGKDWQSMKFSGEDCHEFEFEFEASSPVRFLQIE